MTDTDMLYMASLEKRNEELEAKVAELEGKHFVECTIISQYEAETNSSRCAECAAYHRQLAEWLTELKEAKRLLKLAVEDFETIESNLEYDEHCVIKTHSIRCDECPLSADTIYRCKWRYADEALALIGEEGEQNG